MDDTCRWSTIARSLPGRTDNEIKNYWRTHFKKKVKAPSDAGVRARNRFLKRKQFILQQEQQHHHHRQHLQFNPIDLKGIVSLLDYSDHRTPIFTQALYPTNSNSNEEQGYFLSMLNGNMPSPEAQNEDCQDIIWDGLWNFYDFHSNVSRACTSSRASLNNLVAPSC